MYIDTHGRLKKAGSDAFLSILISLVVCFMVTAEVRVAGDLAPYGNPDGGLDTADVTVLQRIFRGDIVPTAVELLVADVAPIGNPDGLINAADILVLERAVTGEIVLPPVLIGPTTPALNAAASPTNAVPYPVTGSAEPDIQINLYLNNALDQSATADANGDFSFDITLIEGDNTLYATAYDGSVESELSNTLSVMLDTIAPVITLSAPVDGLFTNQPDQWFTGSLSESAIFRLDGVPVTLAPDNSFSHGPVLLTEGADNFNLTATDPAGNVGSLSFTVNLDTVAPVAPASTDIFVSGLVRNNIAMIRGRPNTVEPLATIIVRNARTGKSVTEVASSSGRFIARIAALGGDPLFFSVKDAAGNESDWVYVSVKGELPATTISIVEPIDGVSVESDRVLVVGDFVGPANTGVLVNGRPALVRDGRFYVNNVNLLPGSNTITVRAIAQDGTLTKDTITVTSTGNSPFKVDADPDNGIAPLPVSFAIDNSSGGNTIDLIEADFDGDGSVDFSTTDPSAAIANTYAIPGTYLASITITDNLGGRHSTTQAIVVSDRAEAAARLRVVYEGMMAALAAGDAPRALTYIAGTRRDDYEALFNALLPNIDNVLSTFGTIKAETFGRSHAQLLLIRDENGQDYGYSIQLFRSEDGVWRIESM